MTPTAANAGTESWWPLYQSGTPFSSWPAAERSAYTAWNQRQAQAVHPAVGSLRYGNTGVGPIPGPAHPTPTPTGGITMSFQSILNDAGSVIKLGQEVKGLFSGSSPVGPSTPTPVAPPSYATQVAAANALISSGTLAKYGFVPVPGPTISAPAGPVTTTPGLQPTNPYLVTTGATVPTGSTNPLIAKLLELGGAGAGGIAGFALGDVPGAAAGSALGAAAGSELAKLLGGDNKAAQGLALTAVKPTQIGSRKDLDGQTRPIMRCPTGYVLGWDGNCYPKKLLPRALRKWKPAPRPVLSRKDVKAIREASRAKKRLVKLTKEAGAHASMTKPRGRSSRRERTIYRGQLTPGVEIVNE